MSVIDFGYSFCETEKYGTLVGAVVIPLSFRRGRRRQ